MKLANSLPTEPHVLALAPGEYWWCACGRSKNQPFCDGSHQGPEEAPVKFTVTKRDRYVWLCGCKQTRRPPYCDGHHNKL